MPSSKSRKAREARHMREEWEREFQEESHKPRGRRARRKRYLTQEDVDELVPSTDEYTVWDLRLVGFGVRVRPTGSRSYIASFRDPRTRKATRLTIGNADRISLDVARSAARRRLAQVELGEDPKSLPSPSSITTKEAVDQYELIAAPKLARAWRRKVMALLRRGLVRRYGAAPLASIKRADLREIIEPLVLDHPASANEMRRVLSAFLSWCVDREMIPANPMAGTRLPAPVASRDRVLDERELADVMHAAKEMAEPWGVLFQLLVLTGQRLSEVLGIHSSEVDAHTREWTLPSDRTKNRRSHVVPLSDPAWALIEARLKAGGYLLGQTRTGGPLRIRQSITDELRDRAEVSNFRLHDLRRTSASMMAKLEVQPHVIEAVLNHKSGIISGVAATYNRYSYAREKREALCEWATYVAEIEARYEEDRLERIDGIVL